MKKIFCYILSMMIILSALTLPIWATEAATENITGTSSEIATESATEIVSDTVTESATAGMTIDEEAASEIVGIIEGSGSKTQAIIDIAERLGVTYEEAEELLNAMLAAGDKYLGENELWIGFKRDIQENLQFWVIVIMCALAVLAIAGMIVVQLVKTNPTMRRSMRGTKEALAICETTQSQNSQTLTNLEKIWIKSVEKEAIYRELIEEKEDIILRLEEKIVNLESSAECERKHMVLSEAYVLQILKLIYSRTPLPVSDRAAMDLWNARAMEILKNDLPDEDVAKLDSLAAVIEKGGADGDH